MMKNAEITVSRGVRAKQTLQMQPTKPNIQFCGFHLQNLFGASPRNTANVFLRADIYGIS
jgi:hypothetical protein